MTSASHQERPWTAGEWQFGKSRKWLFVDNQPRSMSSSTILVVDREAFAPSEADARLIAASPTMAEYIAKRAAAGDEEAAQIWEAINASR